MISNKILPNASLSSSRIPSSLFWPRLPRPPRGAVVSTTLKGEVVTDSCIYLPRGGGRRSSHVPENRKRSGPSGAESRENPSLGRGVGAGGERRSPQSPGRRAVAPAPPRASPYQPPRDGTGGRGRGRALLPAPRRPPPLRPETIVEEPEPRGTAAAARGADGKDLAPRSPTLTRLGPVIPRFRRLCAPSPAALRAAHREAPGRTESRTRVRGFVRDGRALPPPPQRRMWSGGLAPRGVESRAVRLPWPSDAFWVGGSPGRGDPKAPSTPPGTPRLRPCSTRPVEPLPGLRCRSFGRCRDVLSGCSRFHVCFLPRISNSKPRYVELEKRI